MYLSVAVCLQYYIDTQQIEPVTTQAATDPSNEAAELVSAGALEFRGSNDQCSIGKLVLQWFPQTKLKAW